MAFEIINITSHTTQHSSQLQRQTWQYASEDPLPDVLGNNYFKIFQKSLKSGDTFKLISSGSGTGYDYRESVDAQVTFADSDYTGAQAVQTLKAGKSQTQFHVAVPFAGTGSSVTLTLPSASILKSAQIVLAGHGSAAGTATTVKINDGSDDVTTIQKTFTDTSAFAESVNGLVTVATAGSATFTVTVALTNSTDAAGTLHIYGIADEA